MNERVEGMRPAVRMDHGAVVIATVREGLSGRPARGKLMEDRVELRVNRRRRNQPDDHIRGDKRSDEREVNSHRMSHMAHAALLIFECIGVPVSRSLQSKRQHERGHKDGQDSLSCRRPPRYLHPNSPGEMVLRRKRRGNGGMQFVIKPRNMPGQEARARQNYTPL